MNRYLRVILLITVDIILVNLSMIAALMLRFDAAVPVQFIAAYREMALVYTVIWIGIFYFFGLYKKLWQYASIGELVAIMGAVTVGAAAIIAYTYFVMAPPVLPMPRSVFLLTWLLNMVFIGGSRLAWRLFRDYAWLPTRGGKPVLIVGAGNAGAMVARELKATMAINITWWALSMMIRTSSTCICMGSRFWDAGRTFGFSQCLCDSEIILAIPSASGKVIRGVKSAGPPRQAAYPPGVYEIIDGKVALQQLRECDWKTCWGGSR